MHRFMLLFGIGTSLLAAGACGAEPTLPLAIVAARNAADLVHGLLLERHDPNERDARGLTPLMWAARAGAVTWCSARLVRRRSHRRSSASASWGSASSSASA